jgi:hypothetical protein
LQNVNATGSQAFYSHIPGIEVFSSLAGDNGTDILHGNCEDLWPCFGPDKNYFKIENISLKSKGVNVVLQ